MARREVEDMRSDFCDIRFNQFTFWHTNQHLCT
jgi:hypothetical protein